MAIQATAIWTKDDSGHEDLELHALVPMDDLLDGLTSAPMEYKIALEGSTNYEVSFIVKLVHKPV